MERNSVFYRGCLLGLAVGDAMGYSVDKKTWEEICRDYGPNGLLGYDLANGNADVTSYTQIAAFMCNGLLLAFTRGTPALYPRYMALAMQEWAKSQQVRTNPERTTCWVAQIQELRRRHCMDTRMLDALSKEPLGTPECPKISSTTPGALTAALAVGLCYDPEKIQPLQIGTLGASAVAFTHGDPEAFLCGAFIAYCMAGILMEPDCPLPEQFTHATDAIIEQFGGQYPQVQTICEKIRYAQALSRDMEITPFAAMTLLECTTAAQCLAGAVYAATIHPGNFDEAMIVSVNHSGRSAAVGALTGAFLGAKLGADALPEFYLESLEVLPVLDELATDLAERRQASRIFDDSWDQKYVQGLPV